MRAVDVPREEGRAGTYGMETPMGSLSSPGVMLRGYTVSVSMMRFDGHAWTKLELGDSLERSRYIYASTRRIPILMRDHNRCDYMLKLAMAIRACRTVYILTLCFSKR